MKLFLITCGSLLLSVSIITLRRDDVKQRAISSIEVKSPAEHQRPADQTFLTYPEWYLVFSPEEFADFSRSNTPDDFPYFGHIGQFWESYNDIYSVISEKYAFNTGYHVMIMVIGGSTTVEYSLRECYEKVVGRMSKLTSSDALTDEDRYAAAIASEYVDFIKIRPWYEFDFKQRLESLWTLPVSGDNMIRKWERRYILTTDLSAKALYGWLIMKMTKASYEDPLPVTSVLIDKPSQISDKNIQVLQMYSDSSTLLLLPRYDAFKDYVSMLARQEVAFREIAGNADVILIACRMSIDNEVFNLAPVLFSQPVLTKPAEKRVAFVVPIRDMTRFLNAADSAHIRLEHVYDF